MPSAVAISIWMWMVGSPRATRTTAIAAITIDSSASSRKIRQKRRIVEYRGLGSGSWWGTGFPLATRSGTIKRARTRVPKGVAMTIASVLRGKGSDVETIAADASVFDAVRKLGEKRIGALLVMEGGRIAGIMSERDVIYCLRNHGADVLQSPVSRVMTAPAITAETSMSVLTALALMTQRRIRHLPVVDGGNLKGIVSIGDLVKYRMERIEAEADAMRSYIQSA